MPLEKCGDNGWRWGQQGKCYEGPGAKMKALKQGYAENPKHFREEMKSQGISEYETEFLITEFPKFKDA